MNKKLISLCALFAMIALVIAGASMAYFSDTVEARGNVITAGSVDISVEENEPASAELIPGVATERSFTITNDGRSNAYVRINVDAPGDIFSIEFPEANGWDADNNMCYYSAILSPDSTASVTVKITLKGDTADWNKESSEYTVGTESYTAEELAALITITAEAIQANNGTSDGWTYTEAFAAYEMQTALINASENN